MCLRGCDTSLPPACCTNSAGVNELPWQTQMMLTSDFVYLYRKPLMVFPLGPLPVVETQGMLRRQRMSSWVGVWGSGGLPVSPFLSFVKVVVVVSLVKTGLLSRSRWLSDLGCFFGFDEVDSVAFSEGVVSIPFLHLSILWAESIWWEVALCSDRLFKLLATEQFIWGCSSW